MYYPKIREPWNKQDQCDTQGTVEIDILYLGIFFGHMWAFCKAHVHILVSINSFMCILQKLIYFPLIFNGQDRFNTIWVSPTEDPILLAYFCFSLHHLTLISTIVFNSFPTHSPAVVHRTLYDGNPVSSHGTSLNPASKFAVRISIALIYNF